MLKDAVDDATNTERWLNNTGGEVSTSQLLAFTLDLNHARRDLQDTSHNSNMLLDEVMQLYVWTDHSCTVLASIS